MLRKSISYTVTTLKRISGGDTDIKNNVGLVSLHNWDVLELTCIEEVHSLAHNVCTDKHNSIVSSVIIWDVLTTVFYKVTLCIDVTTSNSWSNVITSGLHLSHFFNVSVTYSARVSIKVVTVYDIHFLSTRECRMETRKMKQFELSNLSDDRWFRILTDAQMFRLVNYGELMWFATKSLFVEMCV